MAVLGLRFCARALPSCGKRGPLLIAVRWPLTTAASLVAEHRLQTRRLSNCGSRAQPLRGMWDPPRPGLEPVSPALAGRPSTTAPPGKPWRCIFTPSVPLWSPKDKPCEIYDCLMRESSSPNILVQVTRRNLDSQFSRWAASLHLHFTCALKAYNSNESKRIQNHSMKFPNLCIFLERYVRHLAQYLAYGRCSVHVSFQHQWSHHHHPIQ